MAGMDLNSTENIPESVKNNGFSVVLVEPQLGENIGAAARAMLNFGLTDLRLVNPRDGWPNKAATQNASGALDRDTDGLKSTVYATLEEAVADRTFVIATCPRLRGMVRDMLTPKAAARELHRVAERGDKTAVIFGPERAGLKNDHVALAHTQVIFPTNPTFSSLNLAQAVLLMAYEFFDYADETPEAYLRDSGVPGADQAAVEHLAQHLLSELDASGFFRSPGHKPVMVRNLRSLIARARMTTQEAHTVRGMIKALVRGRQSCLK